MEVNETPLVSSVLRPANIFSVLAGVWSTPRGFLYFYSRIVSSLIILLALYSTKQFGGHFLTAWETHNKRETSLNLANIIIIVTRLTTSLAAIIFALTKAQYLQKLLQGLETRSSMLDFNKSSQYRILKTRVLLRAVLNFFMTTFKLCLEPFLWPDYFKLMDILGHLVIDFSSSAMEVQYISIADLFNQLFSSLNDKLQNGGNVESLRHQQDNLSDLYESFRRNYAFFTVAHVCCRFVIIAMGSYYGLVGVFQTPEEKIFDVPYIQIMIYQFMLANSSLIYTILCFISIARNSGRAVIEYARTGETLLRLLTKCEDQETRAELYRFSYQLMHRHPRFLAYGVPVDTSLLVTVAGAMTKYMITMVQFQQSL